MSDRYTQVLQPSPDETCVIATRSLRDGWLYIEVGTAGPRTTGWCD